MASKRTKPFTVTSKSNPVVAQEHRDSRKSLEVERKNIKEFIKNLESHNLIAKDPQKPSKTARPDTPPRTAEDIVVDHKKDLEIHRLKKERADLVKKLLNAEKRLETVIALDKEGHVERLVPTKARLGRIRDKREGVAIVMASDWHVEELVDPEKVNGVNEYNLDIAEKRIHRFTDATLSLLEKESHTFNIPEMVLWLGGDLFTGYIHEENVETSQLSPVESVLWLYKRIARVIDTFLAQTQVETLTVLCNHGNHGRTTHKIRVSTGAENSFEWLLYQMLASLYESEERVRFHAPKAHLLYHEIFDFRLRALHGMHFRYSGGGGGIVPSLNRVIADFDRGIKADLTIFGHWHNLLQLPNAIGNGSLIGHGPYSDWIHAPIQPPRQAFCMIDSERGKTADHPIWVEDVLKVG